MKVDDSQLPEYLRIARGWYGKTILPSRSHNVDLAGPVDLSGYIAGLVDSGRLFGDFLPTPLLLQTEDASNWNGRFQVARRPLSPLAPNLFDFAHGNRIFIRPRPHSEAELDCLTSNFDFHIIRGSGERQALIDIALEQMSRLRGRGAIVGAYQWGYGYEDPVASTKAFVQTYDSSIDSKICWLDLEDEDSFAGMTLGQRQDWQLRQWQAARDLGYQPGLYTNIDVWRVLMGNMAIPEDVLVWLAWWNGSADLGAYLTIGGRTAIGHQFLGSGQVPLICGLALDRSVFNQEAIMSSIPSNTDNSGDATEDELLRLNSAVLSRFLALAPAAGALRSAAAAIDAACGTDPPASGASILVTNHDSANSAKTWGRTFEALGRREVALAPRHNLWSLIAGIDVPPQVTGALRGALYAGGVAAIETLITGLTGAHLPSPWQELLPAITFFGRTFEGFLDSSKAKSAG